MEIDSCGLIGDYLNRKFTWSTENVDLVSLSDTDQRVVTVEAKKPGKATIVCYYSGDWNKPWNGTTEFHDTLYTVHLTIIEAQNADSSSSGNTGGNSSSESTSRDTAQHMGTRSMNVGQTITLTNPSGTYGLDFHSYNWESSDSSITTASTGNNNQTSVVRAIKPGTVTIYGFLMGSSRQPNYGQRYNAVTKRWESYIYYTYKSVEHNYKWTVVVNKSSTNGSNNGNNNGSNSDGDDNTKNLLLSRKKFRLNLRLRKL